MIAQLRLAALLIRFASHMVLALILLSICFPLISVNRREALIGWWSRRIIRISGVRLVVTGSLAPDQGGQMFVLNHISWLDIYVVHAIRASRFVAKSEIRKWPLIGYLCEQTGVIFLERGRRRAVHEANQRLAQVMRDGDRVAVFPEGTTSFGTDLLAFHANLIQPAIEAGLPVYPIALRYQKPNGEYTPDAAYVGDTSLWESLLMVLRGAPIVAQATILQPIDTKGKTRHEVAREARAAIAVSLGFETGDRPPVLASDLQDELQ